MRLFISRRHVFLALFILMLYLIFLVARFPANLAFSLVANNTVMAKTLQFESLRGTIWNATAKETRLNRVYLGKLQWKLNPLYLLLAAIDLNVRFKSPQGFGKANVSLGTGGDTELVDARVDLPVQAITPLMYGVPVRPDGQLAMSVNRLEFVPGERLNIDGRLVWTNASIQFKEAIKLGDLSLLMTPDEKGSRGILSDAGGPLLVEGVLQLAADGRYQLKLKLAARDKNDTALDASLSMLGRADRQGKFSFNYNGRLPL